MIEALALLTLVAAAAAAVAGWLRSSVHRDQAEAETFAIGGGEGGRLHG